VTETSQTNADMPTPVSNTKVLVALHGGRGKTGAGGQDRFEPVQTSPQGALYVQILNPMQMAAITDPVDLATCLTATIAILEVLRTNKLIAR